MDQVHVRRHLGRLTVAMSIAGSVVLVPAVPALAAGTIDQSYAATDTMEVIHDVIVAAQTFTAGRTGSLDRVDLSIGRIDNPGTLTIRIETVAAGVPSGSVLATATVPVSGVPNDSVVHPVSVPLPPSLSLLGTQYAIVLSAAGAPADTAWLWALDSLNGYAGGSALTGDTTTGIWTTHALDDRAFATYVDPTPCAIGTWSSTGYGSCVPADPGSYAAGPGATAQAPCSLGTYQPNAGAGSCLIAPVGTYVDATGAIAATACPAGTTTTGTGSADATACRTIDPTPPTIACAASPKVLWPPNGRLIPVTVTLTTSGARAVQLVSVTTSEGVAGDMVGWTMGTLDTHGLLRATRISGSRTYTLTYTATGSTGDTATCQTIVTVPHDAGRGGPGHDHGGDGQEHHGDGRVPPGDDPHR